MSHTDHRVALSAEELKAILDSLVAKAERERHAGSLDLNTFKALGKVARVVERLRKNETEVSDR